MTFPADTSGFANESFKTTNWNVVVNAGADVSPESEDALEVLCQTYWYPLFAFARRQGHAVAQAQDLTQGFFAALLEKKALSKVDRSFGKFRSFLLASFRNHIANQNRSARAQKRGGGARVVSIDLVLAEKRYSREPSHGATAEQLFLQQWAVSLLDQVLKRLRDEYQRSDKAERFEQLSPFLAGDHESSYKEVSDRLGMSVEAVKGAVYRMRQRYGALVREEIARTVLHPEEIEEEIKALFDAVRGPDSSPIPSK